MLLITFKVFYGNQEENFTLLENLTVRDLKAEISLRLDIPVDEISVDSWFIVPENDRQQLRNCCRTDGDNYLIITKSTRPQENAPNDEAPERASPGPTVEKHEREVILSFIQHFLRHFDTHALPLQVFSLENAISQHYSSSSEPTKIIVLYLHRQGDPFCDSFCKNLVHPEVQEVFNARFLLLGWDISDTRYHQALKTILNRNSLGNFAGLIDGGTPAALVIVPEGSSVKVHSSISGSDGITRSEILSILNSAKDFDRNASFGSKEFQQLMLSLLGDRDYDSFEQTELEHLVRKIGYALYGPPQLESGNYKEEQDAKINSIFDVILKENNKFAKWHNRVVISTIYNCTEPLPEEKEKRAEKYGDYNSATDLSPIPIFILRKCKGGKTPCRIFIDDLGRVYQNWEEYLKRNKLPECEMVLPKNGRYEADSNGNVILERQLSPACDVSEVVLRGADFAGAVGGIASGGIFVAASLVAVAPAALATAATVGVGVGVYSIGRSIFNLVDRNRHGQTLSFKDSEARGAYLNIAAGALGFAGAGANMAVSQLAASGVHIGEGATAAVNVLNIANVTGGGFAVGSAAYDVFNQWYYENRTPSMLTVIQLSSSILFFGHSIYNFRTVGAIVEETQTNVLRSYNDSLRSNRHRKMFNKLVKETIRQNNGNIQQGRTEVISTLRNIPNTDDTFAFFTRSNREMNRNGVRFAAQDGKITLNGIAVDMNQMTNLQKTEVITFLTRLPSTPNPSSAQTQLMKTQLQALESDIPVTEFAGLAVSLVGLFGDTDQDTTQRVINVVAKLLKFLSEKAQECIMQELKRIFPGDRFFRLFEVASRFLQSLINDLEGKYTEWAASGSLGEEYFPFLPMDSAKRAKEFFKKIVQDYFVGGGLNAEGWRRLLRFFYAWFADQAMVFQQSQERRRQRRRGQSRARKEGCEICGGYFYQRS